MNTATLAATAAGVSTRQYRSTLVRLPVAEQESAVSKTEVSRRFVPLSTQRLGEWLSAHLPELDLPVLMIDGIHFRDRVVLIVLGIDAEGNKHVLGLDEGSTEKAAVMRSLLSELIERGVDGETPRLWVIDGGKARRRGITEIFGQNALVQRCQAHKRRNVKRWRDGQMLMRWIGSAIQQAAGGFRRVRGHRDMRRLVSALKLGVRQDSHTQLKVA